MFENTIPEKVFKSPPLKEKKKNNFRPNLIKIEKVGIDSKEYCNYFPLFKYKLSFVFCNVLLYAHVLP